MSDRDYVISRFFLVILHRSLASLTLFFLQLSMYQQFNQKSSSIQPIID